MSTRANVIIKDDNSTLYFYRHSDGYPSETGESLKQFVKGYNTHYRLDAMQSAGWLVIHGHKEYASDGPPTKGYEWKVGAYEPTERLHSDVDYIYTIDLEKCTLSCVETKSAFWDNPSLANTIPCHDFTTVTFKIED